MALTKIDHVSLGQDRPTSYLKTKENFTKLLGIFLEQLQEIEEAFHTLAEIKDLSSVEGVWLDYLGRILGEDRASRADEVYRVALQLRVAINTSDGTPSSVSSIVKTFTKSDRVRLAEGVLSWGQIIVDGTTNTDKSLYTLVEEIKPVTTGILIVQDTESSCFFPAWETSVTPLELFEVFNGTVSESLELVLTALADPVPLYVSLTGETNNIDSDTEEKGFLGWDNEDIFLFSTGEAFEVSTPSGLELFTVEGATTSTSTEVYLPWEIDENTEG